MLNVTQHFLLQHHAFQHKGVFCEKPTSSLERILTKCRLELKTDLIRTSKRMKVHLRICNILVQKLVQRQKIDVTSVYRTDTEIVQWNSYPRSSSSTSSVTYLRMQGCVKHTLEENI